MYMFALIILEARPKTTLFMVN